MAPLSPFDREEWQAGVPQESAWQPRQDVKAAPHPSDTRAGSLLRVSVALAIVLSGAALLWWFGHGGAL